jgi:serine/threonine-protein phosphatase 4 regulatory subunit 1
VSLEEPDYPSSSDPSISVQAFTPILVTLLLSPNPQIGGPARFAVVELLQRIKRADVREEQQLPLLEPSDTDLPTGLFGRIERSLFENELLWQVVVGIGKLDEEEEMDVGDLDGEAATEAKSLTASEPSTPSTVLAPSQEETADASYFPLQTDEEFSRSSTSLVSSADSSHDSTPGSTNGSTASESSSSPFFSCDGSPESSGPNKSSVDGFLDALLDSIPSEPSNIGPPPPDASVHHPQPINNILTPNYVAFHTTSAPFTLELPAPQTSLQNSVRTEQAINMSVPEEPNWISTVSPSHPPSLPTSPPSTRPDIYPPPHTSHPETELTEMETDTETGSVESNTFEAGDHESYAVQDDEYDSPSPEHAAVGRLSSMSLMAAVTASGRSHCSRAFPC